jgi:hypothetical protein
LCARRKIFLLKSPYEPTIAEAKPRRIVCNFPFALGLYELPTAEVQVAFTLETNAYQHTQEILTSLAENGFHLMTPWAWKETALEIPYRLIFHRVMP